MANPKSTCSNQEQLDSIHRNFTTVVCAPEKFISIQTELGESLIGNTKQIFDFVNRQSKDDNFPVCPLEELLIEGFDEEQVWQEVELLNTPSVPHLLKNISNMVARKHKLTFSDEWQRKDYEDENVVGGDFAEDADEEDEEDKLLEDVKSRLKERGSSDEEDDDSDTNFAIEDIEDKPSKRHQPNSFRSTRVTPSVVDDKFFKLSEMERFLEMEDAKEEQKRRQEEEGKEESEEDELSDEEEFDYFEELASTDEDISENEDDDEVVLSQTLSPSKTPSTRDMKYTDFFPAPEGTETAKRVHFKEVEKKDESFHKTKKIGSSGDDDDDEDEEKDDDEDDDDLMEDAQLRNYLAMKAAEESESEGEDADDVLGRTKPDAEKSSFERRQEKLKERIQQLEDSNISEKPWQMIGEVGGGKRPENSLLEERLDFEVGSKPAPVITEETTESIENLIKQRIKDQAWDDVERKIKPKEEAFEFKKRITLDQEKSKISLGEIYEQEYLKKMQENPEEEKEDPAHQEIKKMMDSLFLKLDALSNYHFTPKSAVPELKIVTNVPAISMEEVQPINVTDASLLAPEEVKEKSRTEIKGDTEKTQTDRKRERRKKKKGQKLRAHMKERKEKEAEKSQTGKQSASSKDAAMTKLEKLSKKMSNKTSIVKDDKSMDKKLLTSSTAFFSKLQEEATSEVKAMQKRKKLTDVTVSSKKLKL